MGGSSSESKTATSTEYKTQNLSAPSAGNILQSGGDVTITAVSKPALQLAGYSVKNALGTVNHSIDAITDVVDLSYRQSTNQQQHLKDMTDKAIETLAANSRSGATLNTKTIIEVVGFISGAALIVAVVTKK